MFIFQSFLQFAFYTYRHGLLATKTFEAARSKPRPTRPRPGFSTSRLNITVLAKHLIRVLFCMYIGSIVKLVQVSAHTNTSLWFSSDSWSWNHHTTVDGIDWHTPTWHTMDSGLVLYWLHRRCTSFWRLGEACGWLQCFLLEWQIKNLLVRFSIDKRMHE